MERFVKIYECNINRYRVFLCTTNADVLKKFHEVSKNDKQLKKFTLVIEAVKSNIHNTTQFNFEGVCDYGKIYAIKVDQHRFYTIMIIDGSYRNLFIAKYGKKESQKNDKKLTATIESIAKIKIEKILNHE